MPPEGDGHARALARAREYSRSVESSGASRARANAPVRASWAGGAPTTVPTPKVEVAPSDARASPAKPRPDLKFFGNTVRAIASANARIDDKRRAGDEGARERERETPRRDDAGETRRRKSDERDRRRSKKRREGGNGVDAERWDHVPQREEKREKVRVPVVKPKPAAVEREEGEWSSGSDA